MSTSAVLKALDGMTVPDLASKMVGKLDAAVEGCMLDAGKRARVIVAEEGAHFYVRNKARKPIHLGAKLGPHSKKQATVYGTPAGFWTIIDKGSKKHRIERKFGGKGKNKYARLLRTPYGPRPYVLHPGHGTIGHPWDKAMVKVDQMPQSVFDPSIVSAFKDIWT